MKRLLFLAVVLTVLPMRASDDATRIRTKLDAMDYEAVMRDADLVLAEHPEDNEVRALRLAAGEQMLQPTRAEAEWMVQTRPGDPWSWYARSFSQYYGGWGDALPDIDKALALSPAPVDELIALRTGVLNGSNRSTEAMAWIDAQLQRAPASARLLVARAQILQWKRDGATADAVQKANDAALAAASPYDTRTRRIIAGDLLRRKQGARAEAVLLEALHVYPLSARLLSQYASALRANTTLTQSAKDEAVDALAGPILRARGSDLDVLVIMADVYRSMKRVVEANALENLIESREPLGSAAEMLAYNEVLRFSDENHGTLSDLEYAKAEAPLWRAFVDRACHDSPLLLASAYESLFLDRRHDPSFTNDELRALIRGMAGHSTNPNVEFFMPATELADRGIDFDEAQKLVERGAIASAARLQRLKAAMDEKVFKKASDNEHARVLDVRGWIAFKRGDKAAAARDLEAAVALHVDDRSLHYHYGRLLEARGDTAAAEREWARGLTKLFANETNDNYLALSAAYQAKHGGKLDGFDDYVKTLIPASDVATRHANVLGERVKEPKGAPKFALKTLDGRKLSLDDLHGKVVVVNFWGVWCGWCVAELPELQKVVARYAGDPNVKIVTIDNDEDLAVVKKFMAEKQYDFPVLLDDGYVLANGITGFPTTWFLDRQGRIAFNKRGASDKLEEEFGWRIEALKQ